MKGNPPVIHTRCYKLLGGVVRWEVTINGKAYLKDMTSEEVSSLCLAPHENSCCVLHHAHIGRHQNKIGRTWEGVTPPPTDGTQQFPPTPPARRKQR